LSTALAELKPRTAEAGLAPKVVVCDDDLAIRRLLSYNLGRAGYRLDAAESGERALELVRAETPDVMLLDLMLPGISGLEVLETLRREQPELRVIVLTGHGSVENAVEAMKRGAHDFLTKPFDLERLAIALRNALELRDLSQRVRTLQSALEAGDRLSRIVGADGGLRGAVDLLDKVIPTDLTVLLQGESGTGKEIFARAIHEHGPRRGGPFIAINCAALPASILESELFGHEKGSFTGADRSRPGKFEAADGGTLFLDEVAEMSADVQAKLLRTLQERTVTRLGSSHPVAIDVRIIGATNQDLVQRCRVGRFREDLYYRIAVFPITIPPLRERREDVAPLARHVLARIDPAHPHRISPGALDALERYDWPGNVRELQNVLRRASVLAGDGPIRLEHLPKALTREDRGEEPDGAGSDAGSAEASGIASLEDVERNHIRRAVEVCQGNLSLAAKRLGIGRTTLYRKLARYRLG
jgi:DNA-binding NtrC family response regulator